MRIGWIGGVQRYEVQLERLAAAAGHEFEYHSGDVRGRGIQALERLVERCRLIVIVTETNSHGAVLHTRKLARQRGRGTLLLRKSGISGFTRLLEAINHATERGFFNSDGSVSPGYEAALMQA